MNPFEQIFEIVMYKTEAVAVSLASSLLIVCDKGVLLAARKSDVAPTVKQQIICGVHEMDFDIPKVLTLHVIDSLQFFLLVLR